MPYFPMFIEMKKRRCLIAGGGKVALRKVEVLLDFEADVTVVAPEIIDEIKQMPQIQCVERSFRMQDLEDKEIIIAATDDMMLNHEISLLCREQKLPVNAVDQIEDCTFIFPSYIKEGDVVAAFSSGGKSPVITQELKRQMKPVLTEQIGAMADCLGSLREQVKNCIDTEQERKAVYQEILKLGMELGTVPGAEEIERAIRRHSAQSANNEFNIRNQQE